MNKNLSAFLDMLAFSEGTSTIQNSDNGYNVLVGGGLFSSYADHPRRIITLKTKGKSIQSSAAGRYQILARYFDVYKRRLKLVDFSPGAQDAIAIQMIREQTAMDDVEAGRFDVAVGLCANIWASLPGAGYGQHENGIEALREAYVKAGGTLASQSCDAGVDGVSLA